ncbi:MAG: hypothetical protein ACREHG_04945 [Candidatus Saccharimonadales bacterium]
MHATTAHVPALSATPDADRIRHALAPIAELPDADAVALYLDAHDYRGERGCPGECPIAVMILKLSTLDNITVTGIMAYVVGPDYKMSGVVELPLPVRMFVQRFDGHQYDSLVSAGA